MPGDGLPRLRGALLGRARSLRRGRPGQGAPRRRRAISLLGDSLLVLFTLGVIWTALVVHLQTRERLVIEDARRGSANIAAAAEQAISRTVEAVDQRLLLIRNIYRRDPANFDLDFLNRAGGFRDDTTVAAWIIDRDGILRASSLGEARPIDLSDREHFRTHLDPGRDALFISRPLLGRESGQWSVQFTRKLFDAAGNFDGVVVVSLDPEWITDLYGNLDIGVRGVLALVGEDGILRGRAPDQERLLGLSINGTDVMRRSSVGSVGTMLMQSPLDGIRRILSYRHLGHAPLIIFVGLEEAAVLAPFQAYRHDWIMGGIGLSVLVVGLGALLVDNRRRRLISQEALADAVENIDQGLLMVDAAGRVPVLNRRAQELLRLPDNPRCLLPFAEVLRGYEGRNGTAALPVLTRLPEGADGTVPHEHIFPDGRVLEVRARALPGGGTVRTLTDITERKRAEARISHLAHHDGLTGLANRRLLGERIDGAIAGASRNGGGLAVLCLDLDRFKAVNDVMGHAAGDLLLTLVAARLRAAVAPGDTVARTGGDEFVLLRQVPAQPEAVEALALAVIAALGEPFAVNGTEVQVGTSVGIALYPEDGSEAATLLRNADTALYHAKAAGRGHACFFEPAMEQRQRARRDMEHDLRLALAQNGFSLHFQPVFDCNSGGLRSFEALLRWMHPLRGPVSPAEFVPVAEDCGLIVPLGRWVLEQACARAASWPQCPGVAVNLSPVQIRAGDLPATVAQVLRETGLAPGRLILEVTEGLLIDDPEGALAVLHELKRIGVRISLDDFGTGYASLGYLQRFPFDKLKIDRSFVRNLEQDEGARAIVSAILALSRSLHLEVVAEGVETEGQLEILRRNDCEEVQGFLLGRPQPPEAILGLMKPVPLAAG